MTDESPVDEVERAYRRMGDRLWRAVLLFSGDREVASDAVAEAFAQVLRRGGAVESVDRWVWTAAFRVARGMLKEQRTMRPISDEVRAENDPGVLQDQAGEVTGALQRLSTKQREAVILHYYAGYSMKEVAARIGSSAAAVGVHLHRARRRLRRLLEDRDG